MSKNAEGHRSGLSSVIASKQWQSLNIYKWLPSASPHSPHHQDTAPPFIRQKTQVLSFLETPHPHNRSTQRPSTTVIMPRLTTRPGLSGNMIYHRYVMRLKLWYINQSDYKHLWYITLDTIHPSLACSTACSRHHQHHSALGIAWRVGNPIWRPPPAASLNSTIGLAPATPYLGCRCHCPTISGPSTLTVLLAIVYTYAVIPPHTRPLNGTMAWHSTFWASAAPR